MLTKKLTKAKTKPAPPRLLRGFKDIVPADQPAWQWLAKVVDDIAVSYGFQRLDTPLLEMESLFSRTIGETTDIVAKEMFVFTDRGGERVALRPETTASFARAYVEHGFINQPQPVKLYYVGPQFRYDRPQAGRYRQFYQFGFEVFGDSDPINDAQLIMLAYSLLTSELKLPVSVQVNSIGDAESRAAYLKVLVAYYKPRKNALCEACKERLVKNPLRLLDCKEKDCQEIASQAPQTVDHLSEASRQHFVRLLEYLDELEIGYALNSRLVRGLDYYTNTVFEIWPARPVAPQSPAPRSENAAGGEAGTPASRPEGTAAEGQSEEPAGAQSALIGGGRYDNLVELIGGRPTPAVGFAGGMERIIAQMYQNAVPIPTLHRYDVFLIQLGELGRKKSLRLFEDMRRAGIRVAESLSKASIKGQLEVANRLGCKYSLILGQKEIMDETILIRDMENGNQEVVDFAKVIPEIKKRLARTQTNHVAAPGAAGAPSSPGGWVTSPTKVAPQTPPPAKPDTHA